MQETHDANYEGAGGATSTTAEGLFKCPGQVVWKRSDAVYPIASFNLMSTRHMRARVADKWMSWIKVDIPELELERASALLLLQGMSLTQLLIPNHTVEMGETRLQLAHLILRVDPWEMWRPPPKLTGLVLAQLGAVPPGVSPTALLAALVSDSAPA